MSVWQRYFAFPMFLFGLAIFTHLVLLSTQCYAQTPPSLHARPCAPGDAR